MSQEQKLADALSVLESIVCTVPPDDGVVLLSSYGPSHWDSEANCAVYDHEHFSPLGDSLMHLHRLLGEVVQPDGGEAVNWDWLEKIGFDKDQHGCMYWEDDRGRLLETGLHDQWYVYGNELPDDAWPRNRFQVRRLCEALAIKLTPSVAKT